MSLEVFDLPPLPGLRDVHIHDDSALVRLAAFHVPRLRWVLIEKCYRLHELTFDCPELAWLSVKGTDNAVVRVECWCDCPLTGHGVAYSGSDGQLHSKCPP